MYGKWAEWDGRPLPERPLFYHGTTPEAVAVVEAMQAETVAVIAALSDFLGLPEPPRVKDLRADLEDCYSDRIGDATTLYSLLRTNAAYAGIYHPMKPAPGGEAGFVPDFSSRLLSEDVPCGLVPVRGAAEVLGVATPTIDRVIEWAQARLGREYLVDGRLAGADIAASDAPQAYGATRPEDLLLLPAAPAPRFALPTTCAAAAAEAAATVPPPPPAAPAHDYELFAEPPCIPAGGAAGSATGRRSATFSWTAPSARLRALRSFSAARPPRAGGLAAAPSVPAPLPSALLASPPAARTAASFSQGAAAALEEGARGVRVR